MFAICRSAKTEKSFVWRHPMEILMVSFWLISQGISSISGSGVPRATWEKYIPRPTTRPGYWTYTKNVKIVLVRKCGDDWPILMRLTPDEYNHKPVLATIFTPNVYDGSVPEGRVILARQELIDNRALKYHWYFGTYIGRDFQGKITKNDAVWIDQLIKTRQTTALDFISCQMFLSVECFYEFTI